MSSKHKRKLRHDLFERKHDPFPDKTTMHSSEQLRGRNNRLSANLVRSCALARADAGWFGICPDSVLCSNSNSSRQRYLSMPLRGMGKARHDRLDVYLSWALRLKDLKIKESRAAFGSTHESSLS